MCGSLTMAFSKAARVMISRGRMFFSSRFLMAAPIESHSANLSGSSAGNEDDPGKVMPIASDALAMVFAVYIWSEYQQGHPLTMVPLTP
jgi:hypothetical protein